MTAEAVIKRDTKAWLRWLIWALVIGACLTLLGLFGQRLRHEFDYESLMHAVRRMPRPALVSALAATGLSFAALIGRDACGLAFQKLKVPPRAIILAGFTGSALGNALGFGTLTGGAVRIRIYGALGIKPDEVGQLMVFLAGSFAVALALFGGVSLLIQASVLAALVRWSPLALQAIGTILLATGVGVVIVGHGRTIRFGSKSVRLPGWKLTLLQLLLTGIDIVSAATSLWVLLPPHSIDLFSFVTVFIAAIALGIIVHVPGGLGVFEAAILFLLRYRVQPDHLAAALLLYRAIYFILPLLISALLLALFELRGIAERGPQGIGPRIGRAASRLTPTFLSVITFGAGVMLLVSGATPAFGHRLAALSVRLPLWVVETSHFFGSIAGLLLLFVARGLSHRLDGAWLLALILSITSLALSLAKGLAYGEAGILAFLILLLIASREQFGRRASMLAQPFTTSWFAAIMLVLGGTIWIMLFSFADVRYTRDLWWQFEFDAQAPRALRTTVGVCLVGMAVGLFELLRPPKGVITPPSPEDLARAETVIRTQEHSDALLALMGDKSFLFSTSGYAFLMFARRGRSWLALSDPVGPRTEWPELIWRFVELADAHGGRAGFYQVRPTSLPLYLDAGLKVMKLGEEARITLPEFSLAGGDRAHLRYALKRGEREGMAFELLPPGASAAVVPALRSISADWLRSRSAGEKGFSVAAHSASFLAAQTIALVRQAGGAVAFASIMTTGLKREATIGLMRHSGAASPYAMEFLFTKLILALKEEGYATLSLGMAPLSGFAPAPLSSRWHQMGGLLWRYGNVLYNFQGLRFFKDKFMPAWEPRYLAASGTLGPYMALIDVAGLVGTPADRKS